jgi:IS30 family transposase
MDYPNYTIGYRNHKHLNYEERMLIQIRIKENCTPYQIAKELCRAKNTVLNEIKRGRVSQIKNNKPKQVYLADVGNTVYERNRFNSCRKFNRLICNNFIEFVCNKMKECNWSVDACFGDAIVHNRFPRSEMVCTKTLYNYIDMGLLEIKNIDLPYKLRRNTKKQRIRINKRNLGRSIDERPTEINNRETFGHWEIDTVIGAKTKDDEVLLTIAERKTRHYIMRKIPGKTAAAVAIGLSALREEYGNGFSKVFKTITSDNGSEFAELSNLEQNSDTLVYFTHPYTSSERGTNECHNGLIRRFVPKGSRIDGYSIEDIAFVGDWCNTLPRKILGYATPEELFEQQLDKIYAV